MGKLIPCVRVIHHISHPSMYVCTYVLVCMYVCMGKHPQFHRFDQPVYDAFDLPMVSDGWTSQHSLTVASSTWAHCSGELLLDSDPFQFPFPFFSTSPFSLVGKL
ncbi:hypothetical protein BDV36DRAFT_278134, partial [Aspergillus pseudocaelatus]